MEPALIVLGAFGRNPPTAVMLWAGSLLEATVLCERVIGLPDRFFSEYTFKVILD